MGTAPYEVKDGAIVGITDPASPVNSFIVTEKEYSDFELELEVRSTIPPQIRASR